MGNDKKRKANDGRTETDPTIGSTAVSVDWATETEITEITNVNEETGDIKIPGLDEAVQDVLTKREHLNNAATMGFEHCNSHVWVEADHDGNHSNLDMERAKSCILTSTLASKEVDSATKMHSDTQQKPSLPVVEDAWSGSVCSTVHDDIPQPTILCRTTNAQQHQPQPGAYSFIGISRETLNQHDLPGVSLVVSEVDAVVGQAIDSPDTGSQQHLVDVAPNSQTDSISNSGLVEATVVNEESTINILQEAHEVNIDELAADRERIRSIEEKKEQQCRRLGNAVIVCAMCILVISVGVGLGTRNDNLPQTESPSVYLSMSPSEEPSSAPTQGLDLLFAELSDSTQHRIQNGSTPQYKAWEWLSHHRNITNLPEWKKRQLFALATFYFAFEGENWFELIQERWLKDTSDECFWFSSGFGHFVDGNYVEWADHEGGSISPCNQHGEFTSLELQDLKLYGLAPSIPPEITLLTSLKLIALYENGEFLRPLTAVLPSELYQMTGLLDLWLYGNNITGHIPSELGSLIGMTDLELDQNHISGSIPSELGRMTNMNELHLYDNTLSGWLPSELGLMTSLTELALENNMISGLLPSELGAMNGMTMMWLASNMLSGTVPAAISFKNLTILDLHNNGFSGTIPDEIWQLTYLVYLDLSELPKLAGPIEFSFQSELGYLDLSGSIGLSGEIPVEACSLQNSSCTFFNWDLWEITSCELKFDCTELLCGCNCPCYKNASA